MVTKSAAAAAAVIAALGVGGAGVQALQRTAVVRTQEPGGALQIFGGGSRIGVSIKDVEPAEGKTDKAGAGVVVEDVADGSPAEKAGVRKGDAIVEFDGERVRSVRQLTRLVQETPSGRPVQAVLLRDGQRTTVSVTPQESDRFNFERFEGLRDFARDLPFRYAMPVPPAPPAPPAAPRAPGAPVPPPPPPPPPDVWTFDGLLARSGRLGIGIDALTPQLAEYFGAKHGVLVTSVTDGSAAAKAGVKAGDVIVSVNGKTVDEPSDVRRLTQDLNDGDEFTLDVMRDRKATTLKGKAERVERRRYSRTIL